MGASPADVAGADYGVRDDQAKSEQDTLQWLRRIVVTQDPRAQVAAMSLETRTAIMSGRVIRGMSRDEVTMALGIPAKADTPDLRAAVWKYWIAVDDTPVAVHFGPDGRVADFRGSQVAIRQITLDL
jgi:hypothetical protein